jgi:hypothetical protein
VQYQSPEASKETIEEGKKMTTRSDEIDNRITTQSYSETTPMTDTAWQGWLARNRADERRGLDRHIAVVKLLSIALLLTVAALWVFVGPYERALIFVIALGAFVLMFHELRDHRYTLAVVFGIMVLLYNPLFPMVPLSGGWHRIIVLASIAPFVASLLWSTRGTSIPALERISHVR